MEPFGDKHYVCSQKGTYVYKRGIFEKHIIDFVIVDERLRKKVKDTRMFRGAGRDSDHYPVISRISGLFNRWKHRVKEKTSILEQVKVEKLTEENVREEFEQKLQEGYDSMNDVCEIEELWKNFREQIDRVAEEVCGVTKRKKGKIQKNVWMGTEVQKVVREKKKAWKD
jgi:hypothetical protein